MRCCASLPGRAVGDDFLPGRATRRRHRVRILPRRKAALRRPHHAGRRTPGGGWSTGEYAVVVARVRSCWCRSVTAAGGLAAPPLTGSTRSRRLVRVRVRVGGSGTRLPASWLVTAPRIGCAAGLCRTGAGGAGRRRRSLRAGDRLVGPHPPVADVASRYALACPGSRWPRTRSPQPERRPGVLADRLSMTRHYVVAQGPPFGRADGFMLLSRTHDRVGGGSSQPSPALPPLRSSCRPESADNRRRPPESPRFGV